MDRGDGTREYVFEYNFLEEAVSVVRSLIFGAGDVSDVALNRRWVSQFGDTATAEDIVHESRVVLHLKNPTRE